MASVSYGAGCCTRLLATTIVFIVHFYCFKELAISITNSRYPFKSQPHCGGLVIPQILLLPVDRFHLDPPAHTKQLTSFPGWFIIVAHMYVVSHTFTGSNFVIFSSSTELVPEIRVTLRYFTTAILLNTFTAERTH